VKKLLLTVIVNGALAMGLAAASIPARAQDQDTQSSGARQMRSPDEVVQKLGEKLNLTDDQKEQIKPIIADRQQKLQALRSDSSGRRRQKARQAKSILEDSDKKIKAILTPDQQKQYAEMEQQMKEQMKERRQARNGGDSSN
jgi:Spy/CpxP family protein refolding chaperone